MFEIIFKKRVVTCWRTYRWYNRWYNHQLKWVKKMKVWLVWYPKCKKKKSTSTFIYLDLCLFLQNTADPRCNYEKWKSCQFCNHFSPPIIKPFRTREHWTEDRIVHISLCKYAIYLDHIELFPYVVCSEIKMFLASLGNSSPLWCLWDTACSVLQICV